MASLEVATNCANEPRDEPPVDPIKVKCAQAQHTRFLTYL